MAESSGRNQFCGEPFILLPRVKVLVAITLAVRGLRIRSYNMKKSLSLIAAAVMVLPALAVSSPAEARYKYKEWRGEDGRTYCRKSNGTVGLVVGAAGGALIGRAVDTRGERTTGTVIGAAAGALLGREVARKRTCR
jgi:hypothetical protein